MKFMKNTDTLHCNAAGYFFGDQFSSQHFVFYRERQNSMAQALRPDCRT